MNSQIDPLELQRLVDDQLDAEEQSCLLAWAEQYPENWRSIATAFLEQQQFRRLLRADDSPLSSAPTIASSKQSITRRVLAVAASIVLAIGTFAAGYNARPNRNTANAKPAGSSLTESVPDRDSDSKPQITWAHLADSISEPLIDEPIREILARQGVMTFERPVIYYIQDESGGGYIIPKREAVLVSQQH